MIPSLRPYQQASKNAIFEEWKAGHKRTLLVLPTGCGKTIVFSSIAGELASKGETVLTLAHREELLNQAIDKQYSLTGIMPVLEKASSSCLGEAFSPLVIGSVQTLGRQSRLLKFPTDYFDTIIVDEAHHCISPSYMAILEHFENAKVLGVTATPDRADKKHLGKVFDSMAYEYSMRDAIKEGYLVPIKAQTIPLNIDISQVKTTAGDFDSAQLGDALAPYLEEIAENMKKYCAGRKTVVFLPLVEISKKFTNLLNSLGFRATEINGNSPDRAEKLEAFNNGECDVICNAMLLTEGWDCPSVDCVIVLRPTQSRGLYQQMIGRGTRLSPETGKKDLLILDFLWMTEKHSLCKPCSLVAKDKKIAEKITQIIEFGDVVDLIEAEEESERDVLAEREESLKAKLMENKHKKGRIIDPMQYMFSIEAEELASYEPQFLWEMEKPTERQLATIKAYGIDAEQIVDKGQAKLLLDKLFARSEAHLSTPKQIRLLERYGFQKVGLWSFDTASKIIARIAQLNWRLPRGYDPQTYVPKELL